jgi:hypothetical protein
VSLLPPDASFEELVQDCFVAFRGSGLALSAVDAELLRRWAELGVPFEVVARGIRRRAERALWDAMPNEPLLRSLHACRATVEREIRRYLTRVAGARPGLVDSLSCLDGRMESGDFSLPNFW